MNVNREVEKIYDKKILVLDSDFRDSQIFPNTNSFILTSDTIRDVVGIKVLSVDITANSSLTATPIYVDINKYNLIKQAGTGGVAQQRVINNNHPTFYSSNIATTNYTPNSFNALAIVTNVNPSIAPISYRNETPSVILDFDPKVYMFEPILGSLDTYEINLYTKNGALYNTLSQNVVITIALYTTKRKLSRN